MTARDKRKKRGPKPEALKLEGDWEDAVREALKKPPPKRAKPKKPK